MLCTAFKNEKTFDPSTTKKQINLVIDYREVYVGNYFCHRSTTGFKSGDLATITNDTLTISLTKTDIDSILQVHTGGRNYQFKLKNSLLYAYPEGGRHGGKFFANDSIVLMIPIGRASSSNYLGKKK